MTTFTVKILSVKTAHFNFIKNYVKQVHFVLCGERDGQTFDLPLRLIFDDPETETNYLDFDKLTESTVTNWIFAQTDFLQPHKAHIDLVLDKAVADAKLNEVKMPWESSSESA